MMRRPLPKTGSFARARALVVALATGLLAACPGPPPRKTTPRPSAAVLANDAGILARAARRVGLPEPDVLVEAYLAYFRDDAGAAHQARCRWLSAAHLTPTRAAARLSAITLGNGHRWRAFVAGVLANAPCHGEPAPRRRIAPPTGPVPLAGTFASERTDPGDGIKTVVRGWWVLVRQGTRLEGWRLERRRRVSTDGRKFNCSRGLTADELGVSLLTGTVTAADAPGGPRFTLQSTMRYVQPGPCADKTPPPPLRCTGQATPEGVRLSCPEAQLLKRTGPLPTPGLHSGVYRWSGVTPRADGGKEQVTETWHLLTQGGTRVFGFYRRITRASARTGTTFRCNHKAAYERHRLYLVQGQGNARAGKVTLHEVAELRRPGPCDNAASSLDRYQGRFEKGGLDLSWGAGSQRLERLPTRWLLAAPRSWPPGR